MSELPNAGIHFPSLGSMIRIPTNCDLSLGMQWMALICHAIFSGPYGRRIIPFSVLMHGKEIGFSWTSAVSLPRLELSNFSMPSVLTHNDPGVQQQVRRLGIPACHIAEDTHIIHQEGSKFTLTPRRIPVERWSIAEKSGADVVMDDGVESGSDADSGWSGVSDNLSTDSEDTILEASSVASDQDRFDAAYEAFRNLSDGLYDIDARQCARGVTSDDAPGIMLRDGQAKLRELVHLPRNWPLARLTIPLLGLSKQVDRLLEGYCFQILATNRDPEAHNAKVVQTATHLTLILAEYLADTIAWLMRSILDHGTKILFDSDTEPLLTPGFWILPLYRELLNSASRNRPSAASERARGCTGLVKLICKENKEQRGKRKFHEGAPHPKDRGGFAQWFGSCSLINTLYVWLPASWAPMVAERLFGMSAPTGELSSSTQHGQPLSENPSKGACLAPSWARGCWS